jgi:hypothetical protein
MSSPSDDLSTFEERVNQIKSLICFEVYSLMNTYNGLCTLLLDAENWSEEDKKSLMPRIRSGLTKNEKRQKELRDMLLDRLDNLLR